MELKKSPVDEIREFLSQFGTVGRVIIKKDVFMEWYKKNLPLFKECEPKDIISLNLLRAGKQMELYKPDGKLVVFRLEK